MSIWALTEAMVLSSLLNALDIEYGEINRKSYVIMISRGWGSEFVGWEGIKSVYRTLL